MYHIYTVFNNVNQKIILLSNTKTKFTTCVKKIRNFHKWYKTGIYNKISKNKL